MRPSLARCSPACMFAGRTYMYVAWFSVSNFVTACLLPYVMPFDQGVMQRSFDAGLYVMRLMHGSSTAVTCTVLRRLPKERRLA